MLSPEGKDSKKAVRPTKKSTTFKVENEPEAIDPWEEEREQQKAEELERKKKTEKIVQGKNFSREKRDNDLIESFEVKIGHPIRAMCSDGKGRVMAATDNGEVYRVKKTDGNVVAERAFVGKCHWSNDKTTVRL